MYVANRLASGLEFESSAFTGFDQAEGGCATRPSAPLKPGGLVKCESKLRIPKDARPTSAHWKPVPGTCRSEFEPDVPFGAPFRPTPFRARVELAINGEPLSFESPSSSATASDVFAGEKRHELLVVAAEGPDAEYQSIEYPHTHRRHLVTPTACKRPQFDLKLDAAKIGWIRGVGRSPRRGARRASGRPRAGRRGRHQVRQARPLSGDRDRQPRARAPAGGPRRLETAQGVRREGRDADRPLSAVGARREHAAPYPGRRAATGSRTKTRP